jgi:hypothetical protein
MPSSAEGWFKFAIAVYVASVLINTISRRVPVLAQIQSGF